MAFQIFQTTAEEIVGATDAIMLKSDGATPQIIADFLTVSIQNAQNAADMAVELGLVKIDNQLYFPHFPYSTYLLTSSLPQKASILRFILEEYEPYKLFKFRLKVTDTALDAATQIKAILNITADRSEISNTLISLGTYSNSLKTKGAGRYIPNMTGSEYAFIKVVEEVIQNRQSAEMKIRERLGEDICQWIDNNDVLNPLITGFQLAGNTHDPRISIVHSGNAFESFLVQVANHYNVNINRAYGINSKIDRICHENHLTSKHKHIVKYLGHVRNACDHGIDEETGQAWSISVDTGIEYVHICLTALRSIYDCIHGNYII